jgi:mycothiol synthase
MSLDIVPYDSRRLEELRALIREPALADEFEMMVPPGHLEEHLGDPHIAPASTFLGRAGDRTVGFGLAFVLPDPAGGAWTAIRIGVAEPYRRRGLGSRLFERVVERLAVLDVAGGIHELGLGAFLPNPAAEGFAARLGFEHARWFWRMGRPSAPAPEVRWPSGIELRMLDRTEDGLADYNGAYNASFAQHYHFVPSTLETLRRRVALPDTFADGVLLAYRDGRCVGFCRNERMGPIGIIGILGTVPEVRGIGLGRAMLRWAVASFGARGFPRVGLMVDGENENALALYRSEGFEIERTRRLWRRAPDPGPR